MMLTSSTKSASIVSNNILSSRMSTVYEVQCPVCFRVVAVDSLKRHWSQSRAHKAVRPYPPNIAATRSFSAFSADVDELDLESTAEVMGDDVGGLRPSESTIEQLGGMNEAIGEHSEAGSADKDSDREHTEDSSIEQTFGEGAGIWFLNDFN
jgi:hypothetical protein